MEPADLDAAANRRWEATLRKRLAISIAAALAVVLIALGCGGGGKEGEGPSSAGSTAKAPASGAETERSEAKPGGGSTEAEEGATEAGAISHAAFLEKANAICEAAVSAVLAKATAVIEEQEAKNGSNRVAIEARLVPTAIVPALEAEVRELRALGVPGGDESQVNALLDATERVIAEAKADPKAAAKRGSRLYAEANGIAEGYGLSECPYG